MPNGGRVDAIGDDFTDLDSILEQDGRYTPGSNLHYNNSNNINSSNGNNHGYRISFQSVDDDELHRLMRALVTPVPHRYSSGSPCSTENIDWRLKRHDDTASQASDSSSSRNPNNNRSESVMLFKKINDGDEDVSFDLVASDLNDFIDPVMLEGIMSRPASRAPRSTTPGQQQLRQQPPLTPTIPERKIRQDSKRQQQKQHRASSNVSTAAPAPAPATTNATNTTRAGVSDHNMDSDERMNEMLSKSAQKTRELLEAMERSLKTEQTYATRRQQLVDERRHSSITTTNNNTRAAPPPLVAVPQQPRNQQQRTRMISASEEKVQQKRQSLDMEGMLALRRDSDAIIERRLSLLKVRANKLLQTDEHQQQLNDNDKRRRRWSFTPIEENPSSPPPTTTTTSHRPQDSVDNMDTSNKPIVDRMPVFQSVRARTLSMRETRHEKTSRPYHEETTTAPILSSSSSNSEATTISPYFSATATGSDALSHGNNKQYYHHNHHVEEKGEEKKMEVENQTERVSYMRRADLCKNTNNNDNHSSSVKEMSNKQQPSAQYRQSISSRRHTLSSSAANSTMNTELMSDDRNKRRLRRLSPTRNTSSTSSGNYGNGQQQPQHTMTAEKLRKRHSTIITAGDLDLPPSPTTATGKSVTETAKELLNSIRQRRQSTAEHHHHPSSTSTTTTRATRTTYHQYHPQHEEQRQQEAEARQARLRMRRNTVVANGLDYHDKVDNDIVDEDRITRRMHRLSIAADDHYTKKQPSSSTRSKYLYNEETNGNIRSSSYKHYLA